MKKIIILLILLAITFSSCVRCEHISSCGKDDGSFLIDKEGNNILHQNGEKVLCSRQGNYELYPNDAYSVCPSPSSSLD